MHLLAYGPKGFRDRTGLRCPRRSHKLTIRFHRFDVLTLDTLTGMY